MLRRKVCIITGSRAEYGLLKPLLDQVRSDSGLRLQLVVTGMHLSAEFGLTYRQIQKDGFRIDEKIKILSDSDTAAAISESMGLAMIGFGRAFEKLRPDLVVILGDRFEIFSAVSAAHVARIPIAHIGGGEITEGAFDDSFRHSITKMSQLHFTAHEEYRKRVIQLGESPKSVFNVGAIGLDNIKILKLLPKRELEEQLKLKFNKHNLLVTFHPVTLEDNTSAGQFGNLLEVLDKQKDTQIIFTKANADTFGRIINTMIDRYVSVNSHKARAFISLGQVRYLSAMQFVDAIVGNSSSGIIEAPSFKIGTINIGDRQKGRIRAKSIIDCHADKNAIEEAFEKLYSGHFQAKLKSVKNPYGRGESAKKIVGIIKTINTFAVKKKFFDIRWRII